MPRKDVWGQRNPQEMCWRTSWLPKRVGRQLICLNRGVGGYLPPKDASICFWTFSRLNDPGVWLGG